MCTHVHMHTHIYKERERKRVKTLAGTDEAHGLLQARGCWEAVSRGPGSHEVLVFQYMTMAWVTEPWAAKWQGMIMFVRIYGRPKCLTTVLILLMNLQFAGRPSCCTSHNGSLRKVRD